MNHFALLFPQENRMAGLMARNLYCFLQMRVLLPLYIVDSPFIVSSGVGAHFQKEAIPIPNSSLFRIAHREQRLICTVQPLYNGFFHSHNFQLNRHFVNRQDLWNVNVVGRD